MEYVSTYAILIGHCTYTVFRKNKSDEIDPYDSHDYSFLVTAICPVELRVDGLIYQEEENAIVRKSEYDRIVAEIPTDGFLYPTFTGRGPDVNHVLYSANKPKKVNISMVEEVLGCTFTVTAQEEKATFQSMMETVVGEELNYTVITGVNEKIQEIAAEHSNDADIPVIDDIHIRDMLLDTGVSEETAKKMQTAYRENTQNKPFAACNLMESKTVIRTEDITIQIGKEATDKVRTQVIDGRRYLLIDLDDPSIDINGIKTQLLESHPAEQPDADSATELTESVPDL